DDDWPGMRIVVGGEAEESAESMASLVVSFVAAAVGIYLLLLLLFNSVTQPILVMIAIPFGMVGVILAFALHQQAFGFLSMLGIVGLTGIVVNDSLILVNLVNRLKILDTDLNAHERIISAAKTRLRPIILTSITTVVGLLPMAYGLGGSDPFSAPMALAMGYGILFATPITLVLIPCLLAVMNDIRTLASRILKRSVAIP
ncbi:MAG: efflux RND transporter permease subunit, partial [bacterium]|nr:efflux RND transporter permease subunit [bacterium]